MMHDEIVTYEVAKLAKEKGYPQLGIDSNNYWFEDNNAELIDMNVKAFVFDVIPKERLTRKIPQSLLQRWLREEKGVTICVDIFDDGWFFDISTFYKQDTGIYEVDIPYKSSNVSPVYDTYELALEDALKYTLENLV